MLRLQQPHEREKSDKCRGKRVKVKKLNEKVNHHMILL